MEVAACLWEAALELGGDGDGDGTDAVAVAIRAARDAEGTAALRQRVIALSAECERDWRALSDEERARLNLDTFDWDFCPWWLVERMGWRPAPVPVDGRAMLVGDLADEPRDVAALAVGMFKGGR
jgi:hypothetical protein